jgi:hypothetical protein
MMLDPITMHRLTQDIFSERLQSFEDAQLAAQMTTEPRFPWLNAAVHNLRRRFQRWAPAVQPAPARITSTQEVARVNC